VNVVNSALSSRRFNRWLLVIGGAVLAAGVIAILVTYFGNTGKKEPNAAPTGPAIATPKAQPNIPFPEDAWQATRKFLLTTLPRKNLVQSYAVTAPYLRGGFTLKQWKTGNLPVPYFPTGKIYKFNWKHTNYAHPRDAQINVILMPTASAKIKPIYAQVGLAKIGHGSAAHWTVNYFGPLNGPPVPASSG
jgi:hypothetical protein